MNTASGLPGGCGCGGGLAAAIFVLCLDIFIASQNIKKVRSTSAAILSFGENLKILSVRQNRGEVAKPLLKQSEQTATVLSESARLGVCVQHRHTPLLQNGP